MPRSTKTSSREPATGSDAPGRASEGGGDGRGEAETALTDRAAGTEGAGGDTTPASKRRGPRKPAGGGGAPEETGPEAASGEAFLVAQREALLAERSNYLHQAEELKAQADSLALEHEPGDVQFDEEGGEGGTSNVDRELDLLLSAQARGAVEEIDRALAKIDAGTYGRCEQCRNPIPEARLEALPHAALCVMCKAGGLASRR